MQCRIRKNPETKPITQEHIAAAMRLIEQGSSKRSAAAKVGINEAALIKQLKLRSSNLPINVEKWMFLV